MVESYQRNNTIIGFIIGVMAVGAVLIVAVTYFGNTTYGWVYPSEKVYYDFEEQLISAPEMVTLDLDISVGSIHIDFENNPSLLYRIDLETEKNVVQRDGDPLVTYTANTITLDYSVVGVNVTLGSGTTYIIDAQTKTGSIELRIDGNGQIGIVKLQTSTGSIDLVVKDTVIIHESVIFDLDTSTGSIDASVDLPEEVGGVFSAATNIGSIDITAPSWKPVGTAHYETPNYRTADIIVTIQADTNVGSIDVVLK